MNVESKMGKAKIASAGGTALDNVQGLELATIRPCALARCPVRVAWIRGL
jgi:hypothetical protein